jgi:hypothetical protein
MKIVETTTATTPTGHEEEKQGTTPTSPGFVFSPDDEGNLTSRCPASLPSLPLSSLPHTMSWSQWPPVPEGAKAVAHDVLDQAP